MKATQLTKKITLDLNRILGAIALSLACVHVGALADPGLSGQLRTATATQQSQSTFVLPRPLEPFWPTYATPRQRAYLAAALPERTAYIEAIGEDGARAYARSKGWKPICDGSTARFKYGADLFYLDPDGVTVHAVEAKGGSSQLGRAYGYRQGTPEWAVAAAENCIKSTKATTLERESARMVLQAAERGTLRTHVIRTRHILGEPTVTVLEGATTSTASTSRIASAIRGNLLARGIDLSKPISGPIAIEANTNLSSSAVSGRIATGESQTGGLRRGSAQVRRLGRSAAASRASPRQSWTVGRIAGRAIVPIAIAIDAGVRASDSAEIERRYSTGEIDHVQRRGAHARNWGGMAGGWAAGSALGWVGTSAGAALGTAVFPGVGTAIGAGVGGLAGGVAGYMVGDEVVGSCAELVAASVGQPRAGRTLPRFP